MDTVIVWLGGSLFAVLAALSLQAVYASRPLLRSQAEECKKATSAFALSSLSH